MTPEKLKEFETELAGIEILLVKSLLLVKRLYFLIVGLSNSMMFFSPLLKISLPFAG